MLNVCKLIDQGVADENTMMTYEEKYYHRGSGRIRKNPYGAKYSLKTLVNLSLSISDNVAYKMLSAYFGRDEYNAYMDQLGCKSLKLNGMWASKANVRDYIKVWNEMYDYLVSDAKMAPVLKAACTNTDFNYGTETLADGIDYSHKSGDNFGSAAAYNDAGIVWHDKAYIYAIFTNSEGTNYDIETVNSIMEIVYDIMTE
jgi:beta-lactamase class A